jgi:hypothetical protein
MALTYKNYKEKYVQIKEFKRDSKNSKTYDELLAAVNNAKNIRFY